MKKIFTSILVAGASLLSVASAQNLPENLNGYYRMTNAAFQEALNVDGRYDFKCTVPSPAKAGSIFEVETGKMASITEEMARLEQLLNSGAITQEEYMALFMQLLSSGNTWYYGSYPIEKFSSQGVDYVEMINKLPDYADLAIETFINEDAGRIYNEYRGTLQLLCVFASEIIKPGNLETEATFKAWCESYLNQWKRSAVFQLYLQPVFVTDNPEDEEVASHFTGEYYFRYHTPVYVGNMQKAQIYINNILSDNGNNPNAEQLDIWASAKYYMLQEIARDYPEGTPAYEFVKHLFDDTYMDTDYMICESEDGGIMSQAIPGTFTGMEGYDGPDITITADDIARGTWKFEAVNSASPFAIQPNPEMTDGTDYYSTLYTAFPYQLQTGMTAYVASEVSYEGVPTLVEIGNVVPAETPVIIRSESSEMANNKIVPLKDAVDPVSENMLKGVLFAQANDGRMVSLKPVNNSPLFDAYHVTLPANTAYYDGQLAGIGSINTESKDVKVYDLMGREVKDPNAKGIFIINGKKVIR